MKDGWYKATLGDLTTVQSGSGFPTQYQGEAGAAIPFYKVSDMNIAGNERAMNYENNSITEDVRRALGASIFPAGSVIFPKIGGAIATNKKRLTTRDCCVDNNVMGVIPKAGRIDSEFLFYFFLGHDLSEFANEAHLPSIRKTTVEAWAMHLPKSLAEQRRIVGILDEAFEGIATAKANAEQNHQNARALFESHLQSVFTQRGKTWVEGPLSESCDIKHGFAFKSEFFASEGEYVLLTPGNFYETGGYRDRGDKQKYYKGEIPPDFVLSQGDLLVAMTEQAAGLLGSPILVPESGKFLHNQRLGLVTKKAGVPWTNEFFFHVFNTQAVRQEIHDSASGVKVRHTSPTKIGDVVVSFPKLLKEQRDIVSTLTDLRDETERLESLYRRKLAALDELKKSLLHRAFTGQLTLSETIVIPACKSLPFPATIPDISPTRMHAGILAMAYDLHEKKGNVAYFGHVKAEKTAQMVEAYVGIDLERNPIKDAAGPNDFDRLNKVEHHARMAGYFDFQKQKSGRHSLVKLSGFDKLIDTTRAKLQERQQDVDELLELMLPMDREYAEIFCTVFAGWNNLLLDGLQPTDAEIVYESRENWHPDKLKIAREKFFDMIEWLRRKGVVPQGRGKRVLPKADLPKSRDRNS